MTAEANRGGAGEGETPFLGHSRAVRILQDTGHDLWLFLSGRGLEIRSFYLVPRTLVDTRTAPAHILTRAFRDQHEILRADWIDWDDLLPERHLSAHQRLVRAALIEGLPSWQEAENSAAKSEPATFVQARPAQLLVDMSPVRIAIKKRDDHATEISPCGGSDCIMCGFRHLGVTAMKGEARRLTDLAGSLTLRRRLSLVLERYTAGRRLATPFPASENQQQQSQDTP